jgi:8-oxo-dGTP pyrophosphatase MutT (NUDIX family)
MVFNRDKYTRRRNSSSPYSEVPFTLSAGRLPRRHPRLLPVTGITLDRVREGLRAHRPVRIDDPQAAEAAVALVIVPGFTDFRVLFIRRAEHFGDPWSGHMAFPGGRRHPEDRDLRETAVREAREETGISLQKADFLGELDDVRPRSPALPPILVRPHVFGVLREPPLTHSVEVAESTWIEMETLRSSHRETVVEVHGATINVPAFVVGSQLIWGLTERIANRFIVLLDSIRE